MQFSFLTPEELQNIGFWLVFLAVILLLILIPLTIVEKVVQRNSEKRCTASTNGTYAGTRVSQTTTRRRSKNGNPPPLVYEQVRFYANGQEIVADARLIHGITSKTEVGTPVIVCYDPDKPSYCWARTPSAMVGPSIWRKIFAGCTAVALVVGIVLLRLA